jgi:hypothetical protein
MSALEEYRQSRKWMEEGLPMRIEMADAAIAELEAMLAGCRQGRNEAEEERIEFVRLYERANERAEQAEAELAALKARRCETCKERDHSVSPHGEPEVYCGIRSEWWYSDEYCSRWEAQT